MKFRAYCSQCVKNSSAIDFDAFISISEADLYKFECTHGHLNLFELQVFKFEILFESGLCAIRDRYYMESTLSIAAALERFYEFVVKIILKKQKFSGESIETCFKTMSKQSERQIGAFTVLYFSTFREMPQLLKPAMIKFRNDVVHKGYLPTEAETLIFAEEVYNTIKSNYLKLLNIFSDTVIDYQYDIKRERRHKYKELIQNSNVPIQGFAPTFTLTHVLPPDDFEKKNFQESFRRLANNYFYFE